MNKTIFILLDACQYEAGSRNLGYLEHLIEAGLGAKYKVKGELPSLSRPMYATVLTGLPVSKHGIATNENTSKLTCDHIFSMCKANGGVTAAAAYDWQSELYNHGPFDPMKDRIQLNSGENIDHGIFYWNDYYPDQHLFGDAEFLRTTYSPDFMLIHPMAIDLNGHKFGSDTRQYEDAIGNVGHAIATLLPGWVEAGYNVVVSSDHGMNKYGMHGGNEDAQRDVPLYIISDQVEHGDFTEEYISQLYVAPLLSRLLGLEPAEQMLKDLPIKFK